MAIPFLSKVGDVGSNVDPVRVLSEGAEHAGVRDGLHGTPCQYCVLKQVEIERWANLDTERQVGKRPNIHAFISDAATAREHARIAARALDLARLRPLNIHRRVLGGIAAALLGGGASLGAGAGAAAAAAASIGLAILAIYSANTLRLWALEFVAFSATRRARLLQCKLEATEAGCQHFDAQLADLMEKGRAQLDAAYRRAFWKGQHLAERMTTTLAGRARAETERTSGSGERDTIPDLEPPWEGGVNGQSRKMNGRSRKSEHRH